MLEGMISYRHDIGAWLNADRITRVRWRRLCRAARERDVEMTP